MRIVHSTPDELIVRSASWPLAGMMIAFAAALTPVLIQEGEKSGPLGFAFMFIMTATIGAVGVAALRSTTVTLTKSTGRIEFHTLAVIGAGRRVHALRHLIEARADVLSDADGKSSRLLFAFSDAMANDIDPLERARIEAARRRGFRRAGLTDIPLTFYFTGGDSAERLAAEINAWRR